MWPFVYITPGGGGTPLYKPYRLCAAPTGTVFGSFWSENGYTLFPFWSGFGYGFQGNYGSVWKYLSFQFKMNKKEIEICQIEMHLKKFFVCALILVWYSVRIWRTGRHTPTKNSQEYPHPSPTGTLPCGPLATRVAASFFIALTFKKRILFIAFPPSTTIRRKTRDCVNNFFAC